MESIGIIRPLCKGAMQRRQGGEMVVGPIAAGLGQAVWVTDLRVPFRGIMPRNKAATIIRMLRPNIMM